MKIKVISLNMWWGGNLFPAILDFLRTESPDIVMLQEVYNGTKPEFEDRYRSMQVLNDSLGYAYSDFVQAFIHDSPVGMVPQGNAVLSRFPISARAYSFITEPIKESYKDLPEEWPIEPRVLQHVELDSPAGEINVFNMHGIWDLAGDNYSPERQRMGETILEETRGKRNVILGGDSNATTGNQLMRELEKPFRNAFGQELKTTFNMRRKKNPGYATSVVDVIYVSPSLKVLSAGCPDVDISDHLPLVVNLELA
ncbi:MAG TPA: endonuclease/exonuclease/phosphatase family protein [Candidatus Dormibacteraeota bacterium]|nr:endonuclease/exonuclease/phosphatase family protein [Candidatus Dormibacteraeota bacterium]